ncbi:MAG: hypothetical protein AAGC55_24330, partial [Myxococcota bacterium]
GMGKTTLALAAVEEVLREGVARQRDTGRKVNRPLLVRLNAARLFAQAMRSKREVAPSDGLVVKTDMNEQWLLKHLAAALAQAVADEFVAAFDAQVVTNNETMPRSTPRGRRDDELRERVAQLCVDLDGAPALAELRTLWNYFGVLRNGILFPEIADSTQGPLELVALWTNLQIHWVTSGVVSSSSVREHKDSDSRRSESTLSGTLGKIPSGMWSILTGSAVSAGVWQMSSPTLAILAGLATTLLTAITVKVSSSREDAASEINKQSYVPDRTLSALSQLLPRLVNQLRTIGLAPVFVVDELDKVDELRDQMRMLVQRMKLFVTEQSFFCFLAHRDYFEFVDRSIRGDTLPVEFTYFTDRLFVSYTPAQLHDYLDRVIVARSGDDGASARDKRLLTYALLHRSRLNLHRLRFELDRLVDAAGTIVAFTRRGSDEQMLRLEVLMQVAIERVMSEDRVRRRIVSEPHFGQVLIDALYEPSRSWRSGARVLRGTPETMAAAAFEQAGGIAVLGEDHRALVTRAMRRLLAFLQAPATLAEILSDGANDGVDE